MRIEPPPSLACATGTRPAATAAAEPPLEPREGGVDQLARARLALADQLGLRGGVEKGQFVAHPPTLRQAPCGSPEGAGCAARCNRALGRPSKDTPPTPSDTGHFPPPPVLCYYVAHGTGRRPRAPAARERRAAAGRCR